MQKTIEICVKSFEYHFIDKAINQVIEFISREEGFATKSPSKELHFLEKRKRFVLPQKRQRYTVIRSPHIDKKSRDQFEVRTFKGILQFQTPHEYPQFFVFFENLKNTSFHGVQMQIKIHSATFGPRIKKTLS